MAPLILKTQRKGVVSCFGITTVFPEYAKIQIKLHDWGILRFSFRTFPPMKIALCLEDVGCLLSK